MICTFIYGIDEENGVIDNVEGVIASSLLIYICLPSHMEIDLRSDIATINLLELYVRSQVHMTRTHLPLFQLSCFHYVFMLVEE